MECVCGSADEVAALRERVRRQAANIREMQLALERKNTELDALHYVWCDGGCPGGIHRWTEGKLTAEMVQHAERQARRLRRWYGVVAFRQKTRHPVAWVRALHQAAEAKTDLQAQ